MVGSCFTLKKPLVLLFSFFPLSVIVHRPTLCLTHSLQMTRACVSRWVFLCSDRCCVMNFFQEIYTYIYIYIYFITYPIFLLWTRSRMNVSINMHTQFCFFFLDLIAFCTNFITVPGIRKNSTVKLQHEEQTLFNFWRALNLLNDISILRSNRIDDNRFFYRAIGWTTDAKHRP